MKQQIILILHFIYNYAIFGYYQKSFILCTNMLQDVAYRMRESWLLNYCNKKIPKAATISFLLNYWYLF